MDCLYEIDEIERSLHNLHSLYSYSSRTRIYHGSLSEILYVFYGGLCMRKYWSLLHFMLNSCSLIDRGHVTCEPVNIDIVLEQLILCSNS